MAMAPEDLFTRARDEFLSALAPDERADLSSCSSIEDVLDKIRRLQTLTKVQRRVKPCMDKIKALGDNLAPYFKIIEIFCASHPDWANIVLGGLHLILKLASHFVTFFEKLCDTLQTLNTRLPRYQELYNSLCRPGSPSVSLILRDSLLEMYCCLFRLFAAVARVFSKQDGHIRRTPVVVASLMWKPFDTRFSVIIASINRHTDIVREELQFAIMGGMRSTFQQEATNASKKHQDTLAALEGLQHGQDRRSEQVFLSSVTTWLNAPSYDMGYEKACQERAEGTNEWIFDHTTFKWWNDDQPMTQHTEGMAHAYPRSLLWVNGKPGSGKTVLASSVVETLGKGGTGQTQFPPEVCYYFFSQTSTYTSALGDFYRAIAAQLFRRFHKLEKINNIFAFATVDINTKPCASEFELIDIISQCLPHLPNLYFVVDGVDECTESANLLRQLAAWCSCSPLKAVLFSRPDVADLCRSVRRDRRIQLAGHTLHADIRRYVTLAVQGLREQHLLPAHADMETMVSHLTDRAEGMFLWMRLMVSYLSSPGMTRGERLTVIMEPNTEGLNRLDDMYSRIEARIESSNPHSKDLAHRALTWTAHVSLTSPELKEALYPDGWDSEDDPGDEFDHAIIIVCCGLLEKASNGRFQYIHLTAWAFAQRGSGPDRAPLVPGEAQQKAIVAAGCLSYLTSRIPAKPLSGNMHLNADSVGLRKERPLLEFATMNWIILCLDSLNRRDDGCEMPELPKVVQLASLFLGQPLRLMVWIEAFYTYCGPGTRDYLASMQLDRGLPHSTYTASSSKPSEREHLLSEVNDFVSEVIRINNTWRAILTKSPVEIWGDVTVFTKGRFITPTKAASRENLAPRLELISEDATVDTIIPVFSVSMSSSDAAHLGVLSIFPNEKFRRIWEAKAPIQGADGPIRGNNSPRIWCCSELGTTPGEVLNACSGWFATYEVFRVGSSGSDSLSIVTIPLDAEDISVCLRQSLKRATVGGSLRCSCPLTIAPALDKISILKSVIHLGPDRTTFTVAPICTDDHPRLRLAWSSTTIFDISYSYRLFWSSDSRYVALTDSGFWEPGGSELTFLAIFSTMGLEGTTELINHVMIPAGFETWLHNCAFHPREPVFLYRRDRSVFLWDFRQADSSPSCFYDLPPLPPKVQPQAVSFSHCGRYLAVLHHGRSWPELIPLPFEPERAQRKRLLEEDHGGEELSAKKMRLTSGHGQANPVADVVLGNIPAVVSTAVALREDAATGTRTTRLQKDNTGVLKMLDGNEDHSSTISIAAFPMSIPLRSTAWTLSTPPSDGANPDAAAGTGGTQCTLTVTAKPSRLHYSDEPAAAVNFPLVLRKDRRAFRVESQPPCLPDRVAGAETGPVEEFTPRDPSSGELTKAVQVPPWSRKIG